MCRLERTDGSVTIIAATIAALRAEAHSNDDLSGVLNLAVPDEWPPHDLLVGTLWREECNRRLDELQQNEGYLGWGPWYIATNNGIVGSVWSRPDAQFRDRFELFVEVLRPFRQQGFAVAATRLLVEWITAQGRDITVRTPARELQRTVERHLVRDDTSGIWTIPRTEDTETI